MVSLLKGCDEEEVLFNAFVDVLERDDILNYSPMRAILNITDYKLHVSCTPATLNVSVPLTHVASVTKLNASDKENKRQVVLQTKSNIRLVFSFHADRAIRKRCCEILKQHVFTPELLFVFKSKAPRQARQWYDPDAEFARQHAPNTWRACDVNRDYTAIPTYPARLYVPAGVSDDIVLGAARHRSRQRLPVLTWWSAVYRAAILRSSQPLTGILPTFTGKALDADLLYLRGIHEACGNATLHILDSRPQLNAYTNKAVGGGYEDVGRYPFATFEFENIDNIHVVREAWIALSVRALRHDGDLAAPDFAETRAAQEWIALQATILQSVGKMVGYLTDGDSVLVHCSDGWDRTSQCCALAQLCLDPYFRTVDGFAALVEKDWKSFGHRFATRTGLCAVCPYGQYSPVFFQFVDAVWDLLCATPAAFEFNETLLLELVDAAYCSDYGTFLHDSEKERVAARVAERTPSFWEYVAARRCVFQNPAYRRDAHDVLDPAAQPPRVWARYFGRNKQKLRKR